jgi:hypothetical protein
MAATSCSGNAPFALTNAFWGTPGNPIQVQPGDVGVPLTVGLVYLDTCSIRTGVFSLPPPAGFTAANPQAWTTLYLEDVLRFSPITLQYTLNLAPEPSLSVGNLFSSVLSVSYTPDGLNYYSYSTNVAVQVLGRASLNFYISPQSVVAGQVNDLKLTVRNNGTGPASLIETSVSSSSGLLVLESLPEVNRIDAQSAYTRDFPVFVSSSAAGQIMSVVLSSTYADPYSNTRSVAQTVGVYSSSTIPQVLFQFSTSNPDLTPGNTTRVRVTVANAESQPASNITLAFSAATSVLGAPTVSVLSVPASIPVLPGHSSTTTEVDIFAPVSTAGQSVTLTATVQYTDVNGITRVVTGQLGLYVASVFKQNSIGLSGYSYQPTLIYPGTTQASLQAVLVNLGTTPVSNVNVTLVPANPVYAITPGSLTRSLGQLPVGQSVPITFSIGITNSTKPVNSTLTLLVQSPGSTQQRFIIPFGEQPKANLAVVSTIIPSISSGDGADQLVITLRNTGGAAAQSVTFTLQPSNIFEPSTQGSFTTTLSSGAGTLAPGAEVNLTAVIQVNPNIAGGRYSLVFHASWTQLGAGQPFGQDIKLTVPVQLSAFQAVNNVIFSVPFLVVVVVVIVAVVVLRQRRSRRKAAGES